MRGITWLLGMISTFSFAQIATLPRVQQTTDAYFSNNATYTGSIPQFKPRHTFGWSHTQLVVGTDIQENHLWTQWANQRHHHHFSWFQHGSPDWGVSGFQHLYYIKLHSQWALGSALNLAQHQPSKRKNWGGSVLAKWSHKNRHFRYGMHLDQANVHHELGFHEEQSDYSWGVLIQQQGEPYHATLYVQTELIENVPILFSLSSGPKRIGFFWYKVLEPVCIQVGGFWYSPLNRIQLHFQIQYDRQKRGGHVDVGDFKSFRTRTDE